MSQFAILIESHEARSGVAGNPIVTEAGTKFWVTKDHEGWVEATSTRVTDEWPPFDIKIFPSQEKAEEFAKKWSGHPWWVKPRAYEIVEVRPRLKQIVCGYERVK